MSEQISLHFVDTETTGLIDEYPDAEITEIAIVRWWDGNTEELLHEQVRPKKPFPEKNLKFNASFNAEAYAKLDSWKIQSSTVVSDILKGAYICGSNPAFDKDMISAECFRTGAGRPKWHHRGVNTCSLGMMLWIMGETEGSGLAHLTKFFGIEHPAHTALGDCYAAIAVWEAFFDRFIFRPKTMREALEELAKGDAKGLQRGTVNQMAADIAQFAHAALVSES